MNATGRAVNLADMKPLSKKIIEARTARGLSQGKLAKLADVHQSMVSEWEKDERPKPADPSFSTVVKIANATETPLWWWASNEDLPVPSSKDFQAEFLLIYIVRRLTPSYVLDTFFAYLKTLVPSNEMRSPIVHDVGHDVDQNEVKALPAEDTTTPIKTPRSAGRKKGQDQT